MMLNSKGKNILAQNFMPQTDMFVYCLFIIEIAQPPPPPQPLKNNGPSQENMICPSLNKDIHESRCERNL